MSIKLLKDLNFAEKINANEAITEAGIEILKNTALMFIQILQLAVLLMALFLKHQN